MSAENYWKVVNAVKQYIEQNNYRRPTVKEICDITGISATSHVLYLMMRAVEAGDLVEEGEARTSRRFGLPQ